MTTPGSDPFNVARLSANAARLMVLERIYWHCPVCNDNGFISGWQDTLWNGFAVNEQAH
jgi:hypothetical protein